MNHSSKSSDSKLYVNSIQDLAQKLYEVVVTDSIFTEKETVSPGFMKSLPRS